MGNNQRKLNKTKNMIRYLIVLLVSIAVTGCGGLKRDEARTIEEIDQELANMLRSVNKCDDDYIEKSSLVDAFSERLEYYLHYPQTYENEMPLLKDEMYIAWYPKTGHKFYSFGFYTGGTKGYSYKNYIQYLNDKGKVEFIPFLNDLRYPADFILYDFSYNNASYYLVKQFSQGMSCCWDYYVTVISINNGSITYHPEFFPSEFDFEPGVEEYFVYNDEGEIIDNEERLCYFMRVCGTENCNTNVDFKFDPQTLTITVWDDADTTENRTGATTKREWRLNQL